MIEIINREKDISEVNTMSPLTWAYVGDAVYELFIRMNLVNTKKSKPHMLHIESIKYVKAEAQANILKNIYDNLTEDEKDNMYVVEGPRIERMLGYTNLDSEKGFQFFQKFLKTSGILEELERLGIEEGDTVRMYDLQFDYYK